MTLSVYIAGSSADIDRVDRWAAALTEAGITVVSTWTANVRAVGHANPRDASPSDRCGWARQCWLGVARASLIWLLVPPVDAPTRGAWAELGYAVSLGKPLVCSGDYRQSIFCAEGVEFSRDADAFAHIARIAHTARESA